MDDKADSRKKLEMRKITKELHEIGDFKSMDEDFKKGQKWQKELTQIDQRKMTCCQNMKRAKKTCQTLQSLEDKLAQRRKNLTKLNERNDNVKMENEKLQDEMEDTGQKI